MLLDAKEADGVAVRIRSPCTSSGKWRLLTTTSRPVVGRTLCARFGNRGLAMDGVLLDRRCGNHRSTGNIQFMLGRRCGRKKSWPHSSKVNAPGIWDVQSGCGALQLAALRAVAEEAAVHATNGPVRMFLRWCGEKPLRTSMNRTARIGRVKALMAWWVSWVVKAARARFPSLVGLVVAIGIAHAGLGWVLGKHKHLRAQTRSRWAGAG